MAEDRCIVCGDVIPEGIQVCPRCMNRPSRRSPKLVCWLKAIPLWIKTGYFVPHLYDVTTEPAIIISTERGFRIADSYEHEDGEIVHPYAVLEKCKCVFCGHEELSWYESLESKRNLER